uniref:Uncharacterized protein n=1 Tax=Salvator merianae TaxID=96440 RepID=A0A8D0BBH0_SALMN
MEAEKPFKFKLFVPPRLSNTQVSAVKPQTNTRDGGHFQLIGSQCYCLSTAVIMCVAGYSTTWLLHFALVAVSRVIVTPLGFSPSLGYIGHRSCFWPPVLWTHLSCHHCCCHLSPCGSPGKCLGGTGRAGGGHGRKFKW